MLPWQDGFSICCYIVGSQYEKLRCLVWLLSSFSCRFFWGGGWMVGCETLRWPLSLRVFEPANPIFCLGTGAREQKGASTEGGMGGKQTGASGKR